MKKIIALALFFTSTNAMAQLFGWAVPDASRIIIEQKLQEYFTQGKANITFDVNKVAAELKGYPIKKVTDKNGKIGYFKIIKGASVTATFTKPKPGMTNVYTNIEGKYAVPAMIFYHIIGSNASGYIDGILLTKYEAKAAEKGGLGFPTSKKPYTVGIAAKNSAWTIYSFEYGSLYQFSTFINQSNQYFAVTEPVLSAHNQLGIAKTGGPLGDEKKFFGVGNAYIQSFQMGHFYYRIGDKAAYFMEAETPIIKLWDVTKHGWPASNVKTSNDLSVQEFDMGLIYSKRGFPTTFLSNATDKVKADEIRNLVKRPPPIRRN